MTEHFINRPDFLYYRHVKFGVREKKVAPATHEGFPRPILVSNKQFIDFQVQPGAYCTDFVTSGLQVLFRFKFFLSHFN